MRVLLTGHDGYIGAVMGQLLLEDGHDVVGLDTYLFEDCTFEGDGRGPASTRALFVSDKHRPMGTFRNCDFGHADKVVIAQFCGFFDCNFHHGEDGLMLQSKGYVHVEGSATANGSSTSRFYSLGGEPGDHADGVQSAIGGNLRVLRVHFDLDSQDTNSCCFFRPQVGPIHNITIAGCLVSGGNYCIYFDDGNYGVPRNLYVANTMARDFKYGPHHYARGTVVHERGNSWMGDREPQPIVPPQDSDRPEQDNG